MNAAEIATAVGTCVGAGVALLTALTAVAYFAIRWISRIEVARTTREEFRQTYSTLKSHEDALNDHARYISIHGGVLDTVTKKLYPPEKDSTGKEVPGSAPLFKYDEPKRV